MGIEKTAIEFQVQTISSIYLPGHPSLATNQR